MSGSVNKVILLGHLGKDAEIKSFQNGGRIANLSVATSIHWKDRDTGERKERTEWHRVVIHDDGMIRFAEQHLKKGDRVYIEGAQETRTFDDNGTTRYMTETVVRQFRGRIELVPKSKPDEAA